jgi:hypothetical protein
VARPPVALVRCGLGGRTRGRGVGSRLAVCLVNVF